MRKRLLSTLLALCMVLALVPTVFAAEEEIEIPSVDDGVAPISVEFESAYIKQAETLYGYNGMYDAISTTDIPDLDVIKSGTKITVSHDGDSNDSSLIHVYYYRYTRHTETTIQEYYDYETDESKTEDFKDKYLGNETYTSLLCNQASREEDYPSISDGADHYWTEGFIDFGSDYADGYINPTNAILLQEGDSVTFALPDDGSDTIYRLYATIYYPQYQYYYWWSYNIKIDDELYSANAGGDGDSSFTDVPDNAYCADAVAWAVAEGITNGTNDGSNGQPKTFSPNETCTQAQILTMLYRAAGRPEAKGELPFVAADAYRDALLWAADEGMIDLDAFDPEEPCTRSVTMTFIWQAFDSPETEADSFDDVDADADYAGAVSWAVKAGVTNGTNNGTNGQPKTFSPDETCTREQIVTFLHRAYVPEASLK